MFVPFKKTIILLEKIGLTDFSSRLKNIAISLVGRVDASYINRCVGEYAFKKEK